jgi:nucleotide-binding universal stress UspA family protein
LAPSTVWQTDEPEEQAELMKRIVCATRGWTASRRVQEQAISLATTHEAELVFLYVADSCSCGTLSGELVQVLEDELTRIGRSLLHIAHVRAREQGVEAGMVARCGSVRETILQFVMEEQADVLVIGAPRSVSGTQEFGVEGIHAFAEEVTKATGAQVIVV